MTLPLCSLKLFCPPIVVWTQSIYLAESRTIAPVFWTSVSQTCRRVRLLQAYFHSTLVTTYQFLLFFFSTATNEPRYNKKTTYRVLNQLTLEKFHSEIAFTDWSFVYAEQGSDRAYSAFSRYLKACYDNSFPVVTRAIKKKKIRKPWINKNLHKRIKTKNKVYHKFVQTCDLEVLKKFKTYRNKLNADIRKAKIYYECLFVKIL